MGAAQKLGDSVSKYKVDGRKWRTAEWFADLPKDQLEALQRYHYELLTFNDRMNLISKSTEINADQIHFADSILGAKIVLADTDSDEIYDLGSGNGFPGIVMAILAPERKFILVDKDMKKAEFLKYVVGALSLKNVSVIEGDFESIERNSVKTVVSRALANISKTVLMTRQICQVGCQYYHFKSDAWVTEVSEIPSQICSVWQPRLTGQYELPENGPSLAIVCTKKLKD